jgi:hypothetical protein
MTASVADRLWHDNYQPFSETKSKKALGQRLLVRHVGIDSDDPCTQLYKNAGFKALVSTDIENQIILPKANQSLAKEINPLFALLNQPPICDTPVGIVEPGALYPFV